MTSSNGNIFRVTGPFPAQRSVTRSLDVFFDLSLNIRSSKQSRRWWVETQSLSLWRHCNVNNLEKIGSVAVLLQIMTWDPFFWDGLTWISAWVGNRMSVTVWDQITYPFPNFNCAAVEVCEWISYFIPHFIMDVIIYPCCDQSLTMLCKFKGTLVLNLSPRWFLN